MTNRDIAVSDLGPKSFFLRIANQFGWDVNLLPPHGYPGRWLRLQRLPLSSFHSANGSPLFSRRHRDKVSTTDSAFPGTFNANASLLFVPASGTIADRSTRLFRRYFQEKRK